MLAHCLWRWHNNNRVLYISATTRSGPTPIYRLDDIGPADLSTVRSVSLLQLSTQSWKCQTLAQCLRRWPNIKPTLGLRGVFPALNRDQTAMTGSNRQRKWASTGSQQVARVHGAECDPGNPLPPPSEWPVTIATISWRVYGGCRRKQVLKHTTTFLSLFDHYITSRE